MSFESEKREFSRISVAIPVRYKFISFDLSGPDMDRVWDGSSSNLGGGGLLLRGRINDLNWLPLLLSGKMKVGVNVHLSDSDQPVKALTRVAWIEGLEEETKKASLGLRFVEITRDAEDMILRYIIKTQMPG